MRGSACIAAARQIADTLKTWAAETETRQAEPVLDRVKLAVGVRAFRQYGALLALTASGYWEDAFILLRSLFELSVNVEEIFQNPARNADEFFEFFAIDNFNCRTKVPNWVESPAGKLVAKKMKNDSHLSRFSFKDKKGVTRWRERWSRKTVRDLCGTRSKHYLLYAIGSQYAHASPGAIFAPRLQSDDWSKFLESLAKMGEEAGSQVLAAATASLLDIIDRVGDRFRGYSADWTKQVGEMSLRAILDDAGSQPY